jgi:hypothetical protein
MCGCDMSQVEGEGRCVDVMPSHACMSSDGCGFHSSKEKQKKNSILSWTSLPGCGVTLSIVQKNSTVRSHHACETN